MPIGPIIRQMLGPFERSASELYRSVFVNLNAFADQIKQWTSASNILELGCGEGAVAERLVDRFPNVNYTGIDITPRVGRFLYSLPEIQRMSSLRSRQSRSLHQRIFSRLIFLLCAISCTIFHGNYTMKSL